MESIDRLGFVLATPLLPEAASVAGDYVLGEPGRVTGLPTPALFAQYSQARQVSGE